MHDLRDAVRALRAAPVVSAAAVLSLALGIGANTAIFSILNSLLLKPLPVHEPERLVILGSAQESAERVAYRVWSAVREERLFERAFAWATDRVNISSTPDASFAEAIWASGDFFAVLGVPPAIGRTFARADDRRHGGPDGPVAVISHAFWQRRFAGSPDVIGRTLSVERVPFTIVGVLPADFFGVDVGTAFDVALPLETEPLLGRIPSRLDNPYRSWLGIMARLAPGQSADALTQSLRQAQPAIRAATMPGYSRQELRDRYMAAAWTANPGSSGVSRFRRQYGPALWTLLGAVALVLLIACANVAMLMLARAAARRYEFSVRLALGASRRRLARQLLVESLLLSAAGAAAGLLLAHFGSQLLVAQLSTWAYTAVLDLSPDWRVLGITGVTIITTAMLFGTAPAVRAARGEPNAALQQPRASAGEGRTTLGGGLVVVQIALSLVLAIGAGLFVRSFVALAYRDLGFDRERLLVAIVDAKRSAIPADGRAALYERVREAAAAVAGVEGAAVSMATPLGSAGVRFTPELTIPGSAASPQDPIRILANPVSPGWFRTFGTHLLAGRDFDDRDRTGTPRVAIVNDAFARRYFRGGSPLGRTIVEHTNKGEQAWEVVGVVENAAFTSVRNEIEPAIYRPFAQAVPADMLARFPTVSVTVRAAHGSPARLSGAVAAAIAGVDPGLAVVFQTVTEQLNVFYIRERLLAYLSGFFAMFALLLAALGLYGVTAYTVTRRRVEIGIRMALGADGRAVLRSVLSGIALLATVGIAAGALASVWATRFAAALLYAIPARDPLTFASAAAVLAAVALLAAWLPARRASRIDAAVVLREG